MDLARDYTIPFPSRTPNSKNWGSCIESQVDLKDEECQGYYTRPPMMRNAVVRATRDSIEFSWPDSPVVSIIRLGLGATVAFE